MKIKDIKIQANKILVQQIAENSYIEYKASAQQLAKILRTLCAYGNNYYDNDLQYIFLGVEEVNDNTDKAIPNLPIKGINEGEIEKLKNKINSLRSYLYPKVDFEIIANEFEGKNYLLILVPRQTGGPFMVSDKAEKEKSLRVKPGRYVRIESETRLAGVNEEYDLLRKFADYHFSSITTTDATLDDLDTDLIREYILQTSERKIMDGLSKLEMAESLRLLDKNDPLKKRVTNYAVLMFTTRPDKFIPYAYTEIIADMLGSKRMMESKLFKGPIWKQYRALINHINDNYLDTITIREDGISRNRKISNFTYVAVEELVANAIVHNNYESAKAIQIYISPLQINIVNYNKPLPPLRIKDLNERTFFNERDSENPEIRDMFKALGIIESFGTGIGEAKRSLKENGSPQLYYKNFESDNITSVVIPANEEYLDIKNIDKPNKHLEVEHETLEIKKKINESNYAQLVKRNLIKIYEAARDDVFGNKRIIEILNCSEATATHYLRRLYEELEIVTKVNGEGKGKYKFS